MDPVIKNAVIKVFDIEDTRGKLLSEQKQKYLSELDGMIKFSNAKEKAKELFQTAVDDIDSGSSSTFISKLDEILRIIAQATENAFFMNDVLSSLRLHLLPLIKNHESLMKMENILHQARIMTGQTVLQICSLHNFQEKKQNELLENLEKDLISTFDLEKLIEKLADKLPGLGISSCYLSLYEDGTSQYEWSRLMLAYNKNKRFEIEQGGIRFRSTDIVPVDYLSDTENHKFLMEPLYFQEEQLGFVVFEIGTYSGEIYERLKNDISTAVKGAILVKEMRERTNELDKAYTELKENQNKMIAIEKMASLGRLTAGIAHEMNTPLAAVRAVMKELKELANEYKSSINNKDVLPEDHENIAADMLKNIELAEKAAEKSAGFIRGIKGQTFATNESLLESFQASHIIEDSVNLLEFRIKKSNIKIIKNLDENISLYGNQRWLSQIITNLVNNAIDASLRKNESFIEINFKRFDKDHAELKVIDNGSGIAPENMLKIFDPLFTTKPFGEATGLGLSIVQELVNHFKGTVSVESADLTTFKIIFPLTALR
jgi:signal transduction histidine kinase